MADILAISMFAFTCIALMGGYNVAFTLSGVSLIFASAGVITGTFEVEFLLSLPGRIYPLITKEILMAVPLFVFMGVMLEKSRIAEDLLEAMGNLFGPLHGGLGVSVVFVGALLAASTGIVGATVVTMGLLSLPTMLNRNYSPALSSGAIAASGTLGQIIPPSIVLVILGDQMSNAYQEAQRSLGLEGSGVISVGDLFAGALVPGLILVLFYAIYIFLVAYFKPTLAPSQSWPDGPSPWEFIRRTIIAMLPPILLIIAVLGSILSGYATPTRGAALGALGAIYLASYKTSDSKMYKRSSVCAATSLILLVIIDLTGIDIRFNQTIWNNYEKFTFVIGLFLAFIAMITTFFSILSLIKRQHLAEVSESTMQITSMVFVILIGATVFSLVFRGFGGDELVKELLDSAPFGKWGALSLVMLVMFVLGFFLDFIEITFVVVPLVAPPLLATGMDPIWLGVLMALNLQTSFLTPPFGFALFYLRGVAPKEVRTGDIYNGVIPFIFIQIIVILLVISVPSVATWLPSAILK